MVMDGLFGLNGITGYLIAVVLLLSVVSFLGLKGVAVQKREAVHYYTIERPFEIQMIDKNNNERHIKIYNKE
jgi:hypothetical protein